MDKKPKIPKHKTDKPSKILMSLALVTCFLLPYYLVKHFAHDNKKFDYSHRSMLLPEPLENDTAEEGYSFQVGSEHITPVEEDFVVTETSKAPITATTKTTTVISKPAPPPVKDNVWQTIYPRSGDSMTTIFNRLGLTAKNLQVVLQKNPYSRSLARINPRQKLQFLISKHQLEKLVIPVDPIHELTVYRDGKVYRTKMTSKKTTSQTRYVAGIITGSLFVTAKRLNIPSKLIAQMSTILNKQMNFSRSVRSGDQFSLAYTALYVEDKLVGIGDVQAVRYTTRGTTYEAYKHVRANGEQDYYTAKGQSFKKAFSRYPIRFSHVSSTFAMNRLHPILHYRRAHKGIDLAAPIGTPILATADGVVEIIDRHNGYGNMIKLKHEKPYATIYAHLLRFQRGLSRGSHVKRGQVIGYVGQTGLASGPHCHYELHVNNQPRNPTTTPLPNASPVSGRELAAFKAKTSVLVAQMKLHEQTYLAQAGKGKRLG